MTSTEQRASSIQHIAPSKEQRAESTGAVSNIGEEVSGSTVHGTEHLAPSTGAVSREHGSSKLRTLRVLRDSDGSPEDDPYQSDLIRQDLHARATAADIIAVRDLDSVSGSMPLCEYDQWLQNIIDGDY